MEIFKHIYGFDYGTVVLSIDGKKAFCLDCNGLVILDITSTHNTVEIGKYKIDEFSMYMEVSSDCTKAYISIHNIGLVILDISDPSYPIEIGSCEIDKYSFGIALSKCGTKAYVVSNNSCKGGKESYLTTVDISDASNPTKICRQKIPGKNAHNIVLSKDGKRAFIRCGKYLEVVDIEEEEV